MKYLMIGGIVGAAVSVSFAIGVLVGQAAGPNPAAASPPSPAEGHLANATYWSDYCVWGAQGYYPQSNATVYCAAATMEWSAYAATK